MLCLKPLHHSSNSVEIKSVLMSYSPLNFNLQLGKVCRIRRHSWRCTKQQTFAKLPTLNIILGLTLFNNKNGCNTSPWTGTLRGQPTMFHPLNLQKTVPPLGQFSHKNDRFMPVTYLNVLNFMIYFSTPYVLLFLCLLNTPPLLKLRRD